MSEFMRGIPFENIITWSLDEYKNCKSVFGIRKDKFYFNKSGKNKNSIRRYYFDSRRTGGRSELTTCPKHSCILSCRSKIYRIKNSANNGWKRITGLYCKTMYKCGR